MGRLKRVRIARWWHGKILIACFENDEYDILNDLLMYLKTSGKFKEIESVSQKKALEFNGLSIESVHRRVEKKGEIVELTHYEFEILYFLASHPGQVFTKEQIYYQVWNQTCYKAENSVVSMIRRIRKKIEVNSNNPVFIQTVWGSGYKFNHMLIKKQK